MTNKNEKNEKKENKEITFIVPELDNISENTMGGKNNKKEVEKSVNITRKEGSSNTQVTKQEEDWFKMNSVPMGTSIARQNSIDSQLVKNLLIFFR